MLKKDFAVFIEQQRIRFSIKELHLQFSFQTTDRAAQGRLRDKELMCSLTDILTFCYRDELVELGKIHIDSLLSHLIYLFILS